jgi:hypothetical protein
MRRLCAPLACLHGEGIMRRWLAANGQLPAGTPASG